MENKPPDYNRTQREYDRGLEGDTKAKPIEHFEDKKMRRLRLTNKKNSKKAVNSNENTGSRGQFK